MWYSAYNVGWERLVALLRPAGGGLMWRSSKADVAAELGLPPQRERLTPLSLSAIERHFYHRQHQARVFTFAKFSQMTVSALPRLALFTCRMDAKMYPIACIAGLIPCSHGLCPKCQIAGREQ